MHPLKIFNLSTPNPIKHYCESKRNDSTHNLEYNHMRGYERIFPFFFNS